MITPFDNNDWYDRYCVGYICKNINEFINCQKFFINKGYSWQYEHPGFIIKPIVVDSDMIIYLDEKDKHFGYDHYENVKGKLKIKLKYFNNRERKLERILNEN